MSQVDEQLDEQGTATDASSDTSGVAAFAVGDGDAAGAEAPPAVPQEGDADYEPDEPAEPEKEVAVGNVERARAKVQLDIEDAPFLEDDEEEEEGGEGGEDGKSDPDAKEGEEGESDEDAKKKKKKKLLIFGGIGLLVLIIIIAVVAFLFLGGGEDETVEEEDLVPEVLRDEEGNVIPNPELEPFIVIVEPFVEPTGPPVYSLDLEPFWVEVRDEEGNTFFVVCNFTLIVDDERGLASLEMLVPSIRDAIYYHLATQEFNLLTNSKNLPVIRSSLMTRVNELLSGIKLSDLLYTNYTVR